MRSIERTRTFKHDYIRESRVRHGNRLDKRLAHIVITLANDTPIASHNHDHALSDTWADFRDCHVRPVFILIYEKEGPYLLRLILLGYHSELGFWLLANRRACRLVPPHDRACRASSREDARPACNGLRPDR